MIPEPTSSTIKNKQQYDYIVKNLKLILASVRFDKSELTDIRSATVSVADAVERR